jgi:adenylate cyclase
MAANAASLTHNLATFILPRRWKGEFQVSAASQQPLHKRFWTTAREYLTHWFVAGLIVTLTGFTPDHWVERLLHYFKPLHEFGPYFPAIDYRLLIVGAGVAIMTANILLRSWRGQITPLNIAGAPSIAEPGTSKDRPSIAVLPLINMSDDKSQEYFADGMTDDIINGLSCDSRLFVIARNSTFAYKGQTPDVRTVGRELGVRYVLEGSIRPINDRLRINVQLVETDSGTHVWGDKIDRPAGEIFDIMDDVVDGIVTALCSNLGIVEAKRAERQLPENLQAWALCVQAETYSLQPGAEAAATEEALLRQAAKIEPGYAVSWALLAKLASSRISAQTDSNIEKDGDETIALAAKAMRLAPQDPVVLGYCGFAFILSGQTTQGIDCLERSLELNPNSGKFRLYYGFALWADGRPEAGITHLDSFLRLSPKDPHLGLAYVYYSNCYLAMEDFPRAEEAARKAIKFLPSFSPAYLNLALSLTALGRTLEAGQVQQKVLLLAPGSNRQSSIEFYHRVLRRPEDAKKVIELRDRLWRDMDTAKPV